MAKEARILITIIIFLLAPGVFAADMESNPSYFFKISLSHNDVLLTIAGADSSESKTIDGRNIKKSNEDISINGAPFLSRDGFYFGGKLYPIDSIDRVRLEINGDGKSDIYFLRKLFTTEKRFRARRQNEISIMENIAIGSDRFVRGSVVSLWADIKVDGEVNEDVIAIFGNITVGENAVIRGNLAAVNGTIDVSPKATVYGSIQSPAKKNRYRLDRWKRWYRKDKYFSPIAKFYYNRIDGATPYLGVSFLDEDSILPEINVYAGYGFESKRWRYHIGLEKTFLKTTPLTFGGSVYRRLASNDDWIVSPSENSTFALLATEDFMDYFEADGGYGFGRVKFFNTLSLETGILSEKYKWLNAHRELWSLFGGQKRFPENFSTVDGAYRDTGIGEIDSREMTSSVTRIKYSSRKSDELFKSSFWDGWAELEIAPDRWNKNFDFTKFILSLSRHQSFGKESGLMVRAVYGGSDGHLPLQRRYFLGGLGTLQGYYHKEYVGNKFWFGEMEYGIQFPHSDMIGWAFYEVGQIASDAEKLEDSEMKHSLGIGISLSEEIRLNIARRLDRSDVSPRIYVRLEHLF